MLARTVTRTENAIREHEFEALMKQHYRQTFNFAYRLTGDRAEAEDLVQEAFLRAYRFIHRYDNQMPFQNWLYRILSNAFVDLKRKSRRWALVSLDQPANGTGTWDIADKQPNAEAAMMDGSVNDALQAALTCMNPEFRTAVLLSDIEGLSYEEIADIMDCSLGTVRSRIHRGRNQLRVALLKIAPDYYKEVAGGL